MNNDWVTWVIQFLIGLGFSIIAYFFKKDQASLQSRLEKVECRLDKHDEKFEQLPYTFVTREDFIRSLNTVNTSQRETNQKLDKIYDILIKNHKE